MLGMKRSRNWIAVVGAVVAGGVFAGAVIAAQLDERGIPQDLEASLRSDPLVQVADIPADGGLGQRGVFVQQTSAGFLCLWDAPNASSRARQGGCNDVDDPFGGRDLFLSLAYDGGPAVADVRDARLIGLVPAEVREVAVLMSDGSRRRVNLRKASIGDDSYRAFGYRFRSSDLRRGIEPTAVLALDDAGEEVDRQPTGFAG